MEKIFFTIDSAGDLPKEISQRCCEIEVIPLHIILGEESFKEGVDVQPLDVTEYVDKTKKLPKTSAVTVGEYIDVFKRLRKGGYSVIHISLSSKMSGSHQSALIASKEFENVYVIDSLLATSAMSLLLLKGCEMRENGLSIGEIIEQLEELKEKIKINFIINSLDYLHKGGRCSALARFGANALGIKFCIESQKGALGIKRKYRGRLLQCQLSYIDDLVSEYKGRIDNKIAIFAYTPGISKENKKIIKENIEKNIHFEEIITTQAGCTMTSHCGPETIAFLFITND